MRGRRPKPTHLKVLLGTAQHVDRTNYREPMPATNIAEPPEWFDAEMTADWQYVVAHSPPGLLKQLDRGLLEHWVETGVVIRRAARVHKRCRSDFGKKAQACITTLRLFVPLRIKLATELGLSPLARPRLAVTPEPDERASEFEKLMG